MLSKYSNKKISAGEVKEVEETKVFSFPTYGVSVEATSIEEAEKKLEQILNKQ